MRMRSWFGRCLLVLAILVLSQLTTPMTSAEEEFTYGSSLEPDAAHYTAYSDLQFTPTSGTYSSGSISWSCSGKLFASDQGNFDSRTEKNKYAINGVKLQLYRYTPLYDEDGNRSHSERYFVDGDEKQVRTLFNIGYKNAKTVSINQSGSIYLSPGNYKMLLYAKNNYNKEELIYIHRFEVVGNKPGKTEKIEQKPTITVAPAKKPVEKTENTDKEVTSVVNKKTYSYSRWKYYNTAYNKTYYSYTKYTGSSYKEGSGSWEYKTTSTPLKKTKVISGHQQYEGNWYNETVNGSSGGGGNPAGPSKTKPVTTSKPTATPKPSTNNGSTWGSWSGWSTTPVSASSTRQVETKQETKTTTKTTYSYSRWKYYNTAYSKTYYSYAKYTGSSYKEGSGSWEYKTTTEPLGKTKVISGHQQYKGNWYNQKTNTEETTTTVTYYRYRDKEK